MPVMRTIAGEAPAPGARRQWDSGLPEVFDETSLWKRMDQAAEVATMAAGRQVGRNQAHPGLRLQNRKG
jgi:hypothetical protein